MKPNKIISIILSIIIVLSFTACSSNTMQTKIVDEDDSPLMIYIWDRDEAMKHYINIYNSLFDEVQIEYEVFSSDYLKHMISKIENGIKDGNGPDLIKIDNFFLQLLDIPKMVDDDLLANMDILFENSKHFDKSLYNKDMLDGGIVNGKRAFVPISYDIDATISTKQSFEKNGLKPLDTLKADNLFITLDEFYQNTPDDKSPFYNINVCMSAFNYLDEDNYLIESSEFRRLLDIGKEAYKREKNSGLDEARKNENFDMYAWYDWYFDNDILFTGLFGKDNDIYTRFYNKYSLFKDRYNSEMLVYKYPLLSDKLKAYPETAFAISATSNKKNKAFKFIEYMLSSDVQSSCDYTPTIPVNKECYQIAKDRFISGNYDFVDYKDITPATVPDELVYKFIDLVEDADYCFDNTLHLYCFYVGGYLQMYIRGGKRYDTLIEDINEILYKYYNDIDDYHF